MNCGLIRLCSLNGVWEATDNDPTSFRCLQIHQASDFSLIWSLWTAFYGRNPSVPLHAARILGRTNVQDGMTRPARDPTGARSHTSSNGTAVPKGVLCERHEQEALNSAPCLGTFVQYGALRTDRSVGCQADEGIS